MYRLLWVRIPAAILLISATYPSSAWAVTRRLEPGAAMVKAVIMGGVGAFVFWLIQRSKKRKAERTGKEKQGD